MVLGSGIESCSGVRDMLGSLNVGAGGGNTNNPNDEVGEENDFEAELRGCVILSPFSMDLRSFSALCDNPSTSDGSLRRFAEAGADDEVEVEVGVDLGSGANFWRWKALLTIEFMLKLCLFMRVWTSVRVR